MKKSGKVSGHICVVSGEPLILSPESKHPPGASRSLQAGENKISRIITGGQSGVDRGAFDFARSQGVDIGGWCPLGGWAEDLPRSPGLLRLYPEMKESNSRRVEQRTQWNVRDSDATIIFLDKPSVSGELASLTADALGLPYMEISLIYTQVGRLRDWLTSLSDLAVLNVAGPRESESPGSYQKTKDILEELFSREPKK